MQRNFVHDIEQRFEELRQQMFNLPHLPACDLAEEADAYALTIELPGMSKEDVRLEIDARGAHVHGERKEEKKEERKGFVRQERSSRVFDRYIAFPQEVSPDGAHATFKNGVLDVRVPKLAPERRDSRHVEIE